MAVETPLSKEVTRSNETDDCLFASLRNDGELDLALLNVKNRVAVPSGMRLEFGGAISSNMRLSFQAARSIG